MHSIFSRIFLSFLLTMVLIGGALVLLTTTTDPRRAEFARHQARLARVGAELVERYHAEGVEGLRAAARTRRHQRQPPAFLFRDGRGPLSGDRAPPMTRRLAAQTALSGENQFRRSRRGLWLATPLEDGFVLVSEVAPPTRLQRLLDPHRLAPRLGVAFLIACAACYLLARSLSAPIRHLRLATQELAAGNVAVRVAPQLGRRRDETAQLARDFDHMAGRIEGLLAAQQRLLRDISHELRSPLARLHVALELARQRAGAEAQGSLERIEREAQRLNELIGQVLTLVQLEDGRAAPAREVLDLAQMVADICQDANFEASADERAVRPVDLEPLSVNGVPHLLHSAVENVVRNALRFTAAGTSVEVHLQRAAGVDSDRARLTVRDHGPGVPAAALAELFRPFYRVAEARERDSGGSGIGLAIAERAVRLHGGEVRAENAEGGGLRVVLELPLTDRA